MTIKAEEKKKQNQKYRVKIYLTWYKYDANHILIGDAIKEIGGISAVHQSAYEEFPSVDMQVISDVCFGFSRWNVEVERTNNSQIPYYVTTGYLKDYISPNRNKQNFLYLRSSLLDSSYFL